MTDAADTGAAVLAGLARGRAIANARAQAAAEQLRRQVIAGLGVDLLNGKDERGRAGRIKRRLHLQVGERHIRRILDTLYSMSDSSRSTPATTNTEVPDDGAQSRR